MARGVGVDSFVNSVRNMVAALARICAIAAGGILVVRGETTVGTVVAFLGYVGGLFGPVQGLTNVYQTIRRAAVSLEIVFSILDTRYDLGDAPDARDVPRLAGHVHFDNVSFGYTPSRRVLHAVDLRVRSGEVIAIVGPSADYTDIETCARAANAHEFIMKLDHGYDTMVGERGGNLSMGERQRIAIARALLKNPPMLILDEATSALDAESEALVQEALARLIRGRTTFIIAHRLATVVDADRILVLRHGRIEEVGTHGELMRADGYYASLVNCQTRGLVAAS